MTTDNWLAIVGIVVALIGLWAGNKSWQNKKIQKNKISIISNGNTKTRDIVGGDNITHESDSKTSR